MFNLITKFMIHDRVRRDAKGRSKKQKEKTEARIFETIRSENELPSVDKVGGRALQVH